jgi:exosortase/archaeosortase
MLKNSTPQQKAAVTRKWVKIEITVLFVLLVEFCLQAVETILNQFRGKLNPHLHVLVLMISIVALFYFAIGRIEGATNWLIEKTTAFGSEIFGRRTGVTLVVLLMLIILYIGFYFLIFGRFALFDLKVSK